jgi:arylsulfatase A-like enzyme
MANTCNSGLASFGVAVLAAALAGSSVSGPLQAQSSKPNILFFLLDDVGIDQLAIFENSAADPPVTPNINLIARAGVKFTNAWAMPECSPSRAAIFTGRYPLRTGVEAAIVSGHLPQSYVSQFETTLPRVLEKAGYKSALVGKYHLGSDQDPAGTCAPQTRGFSYFTGGMTAGPPSVDTTAGGVAPEGSQVCGYYQTQATGACYTAPGDSVHCSFIDAASTDPKTDPARTCLQRGGIFVPNKACGVNAPKWTDFNNRYNGYYAWPRTTLKGLRDPLYVDNGSCPAVTDRTYLTKAQGEDGVSWWKQHSGPRMLTVSFNAMHTPVQKPPTDMVPDPQDAASTCSNSAPPRNVANMMIEGVDVQIGRVLADLGLARLDANGRRIDPSSLDLGNTVVVIIGDNGSQGPFVRPGTESPTIGGKFNPLRAKTTVYQTGVWVPLIIAGAPVAAPGRSVDHIVNVVDLFQLFGDLAGVKAAEIVPPSHTLDSQPMLPYLTTPGADAIRDTSFTQEGVATYSPDPAVRSWPCVLGNPQASGALCNDTLFDSKDFCENDNGGTWFGPGSSVKQLNSCCAVQAFNNATYTLAPVHQLAMRDRAFKLIELQRLDCSKPITNASQKAFPWADYQAVTSQEFYDVRKRIRPNNPNGIDNAPYNLAKNCAPGQDFTTCLPTQLDVNHYVDLNNTLTKMKNSAKAQNRCQSKGDGNQDLRVTQADIDGWTAFNGKGPSRYDINLDGVTDDKDLQIIKANLGLDCLDICKRADLNRDGKVNSADLTLLNKQKGACTDLATCGGDLNGDGKVDSKDVSLMRNAQRTCQ